MNLLWWLGYLSACTLPAYCDDTVTVIAPDRTFAVETVGRTITVPVVPRQVGVPER